MPVKGAETQVAGLFQELSCQLVPHCYASVTILCEVEGQAQFEHDPF